MRLSVGAVKEFLDKVGGPLQRPMDHAGASSNGDAPPPPLPETIFWHTESRRCSTSLIPPQGFA